MLESFPPNCRRRLRFRSQLGKEEPIVNIVGAKVTLQDGRTGVFADYKRTSAAAQDTPLGFLAKTTLLTFRDLLSSSHECDSPSACDRTGIYDRQNARRARWQASS